MSSLLDQLIDPSSLTPHGFCLAWDPGLIWLQATSDILIALAYFSIPLALATFARRRTDLSFSWVLWLFTCFIAACGTTHVFGALTLWVPAYWPDGLVKAITAVLSLTTAALLWPLIPKALALPSPAALQRANEALQQQATAREAAVLQLVDNERRYRAFFNEAPVAMHSLDAEMRIVAVSNQWLAMLGYERENVLGQPLTNFQDDESNRRMRAEWDAAARSGTARVLEQRFVRRDNQVLDIVLSSTIQADAVDGTWRSICVLTDITAKKRTEAALRESERRLRQAEKMSALGQLAGGIAHDFNNILQAVQGGAALIERGVGDSEPLRRLAKTIISASERGASITSRLLVFARHGELRSAPVDAAASLTGLSELLSHTLGRGITVTAEIAPGLPPVMADKDQLETVLINLATNARDAMDGVGRLTLAAECVNISQGGDHPVDVAAGPYIRLSVRDTGFGMTPETLARATEPFFTTKPVGQGTGLGLSMAQGFAEQSGGALSIQSAPGHGTTVSIWLPVSSAALEPRTAARREISEPDEDVRQAAILLADDEEVIRTLLAAELRAAGYNVTTRGSGKEALDVIRTGQPVSLLISDLSMPGLDGIALITEAQRKRPGLPAILLTGFATHVSELASSQSTGVNFTVLRKPVTAEQLCDHVAVLLESVRMRARLVSGG